MDRGEAVAVATGPGGAGSVGVAGDEGTPDGRVIAVVPSGPVGARPALLSLSPIVFVLVASLFARWLSVRTGRTTEHYSALDLPVLGKTLFGLAVVVVVAAVFEGLILGRWPLTVATLAATTFLFVAVAILVFEEFAASLIPTGILPTSARRLAVDFYGGIGIWVGVLSALIVVVGGRLRGGALGIVRATRTALRRLPTKALSVWLAAALAVILAVWARYLPWASGSAGPEQIEIPGWSLPYVGPLTLLAVIMLGAAVVAYLLTRSVVAALVMVFAGWLLTFLAAVAFLVASTLGRIELDSLLPDAAAAYAPEVAVRWGLWLMFAIGWLATLCGMATVWATSREGA